MYFYKQINNKGFGHLALVIIVFVLGVAGLLYYTWQKGLIKTTPSGNASPTPSTTADETANWKNYINENLGFSVKLPIDLEVVRETRQKVELGNSNFKTTTLSISTVEETPISGQIEKTLLDGKSAEIFRSEQNILKRNDRFYFLVLQTTEKPFLEIKYVVDTLNPSPEEIFDQILSTFKFADQAESSALRVDCSGMAEGTGITYLGSYFLGSQCAFNTRQECEAADVVVLNGNKLDETWGQDGTHDCVWFEENDPLNRCKPKYYCGS